MDKFTPFFTMLRRRGITVGTGEMLDAVTLLSPELLENREYMKSALSALLAKSEREQEIFSECFDEYFVPAAAAEKRRVSREAEETLRRARREELKEELVFDGKPIELSEKLMDAYADMSEEKRRRLKNYLGISTENDRRSPFSYIFMRRILENHLKMEDTDEEANDAAVGGTASNLIYRDISQIGEAEMPQAVSLMQSLVRQLSGAVSRSYKRSNRKGRLDFRATFRAGLSDGGLHKLKYVRKHRTRKRVVLLCDVSGSMLKYSEFAIRFIKSMSDVSDSSRVFIFSEHLCEVSPFVLVNMDSFQSYVKDSGLWGRGTDLSAALHELMAVRPSALGRNTVFMIISDTKTVSLPEARTALQKSLRNVGKCIWLNPVPKRKWQRMSSVRAFYDLCDMLDCSTIHELSRACAKTLFK